jgi:hypothetical protein
MNPALGLAAARVVIGGCALATPDLGTRLFRLDGPGNPQLPYMTRLFGSREIALGAATLLASGKTRRNLVLAGIAVDAADAAAAWLAGEARAVDRTTAALLTAPAVAAVVAGVVGIAAGTRVDKVG